MYVFTERRSVPYNHIGNPLKIFLKRERLSAVACLLLFVGACLLIYPFLGNAINEMTNTKAIHTYKEIFSSLTEEEKLIIEKNAHEYNEKLADINDIHKSRDILKNYKDILNIDGEGMMGYVKIPVIHVDLAIYHGFEDNILDRACGHLEGTSFPIGGPSTHAVISAHRGLPSAKLFSDLNKLVIGDIFSIEVLDYILYYEVDQIRVVEPDDESELHIIPGEDYVTLLTCTPYGINTHRLLVRGHRTDNPYGNYDYIKNEAFRLDPWLICFILGLSILTFIIIWVITRYKQYQEIDPELLDELERQWVVKKAGEYNVEPV